MKNICIFLARHNLCRNNKNLRLCCRCYKTNVTIFVFQRKLIERDESLWSIPGNENHNTFVEQNRNQDRYQRRDEGLALLKQM